MIILPKLFLNVGEEEKHEIEVDCSNWTAKVLIRIDGRIVTETGVILNRTLSLNVGNKEKHKVDVRISGTIGCKIEVFVDGVLKASS